MPRFAANLSMLYGEHDFVDRFDAAARDGFEAVEFLFPYAHDGRELAARLRGLGLKQVLFNAPPGDWDAGERGMACHPGRERECLASIDVALGYAQTLGTRLVHVMAGLVPAGVDRDTAHRTYVSNLTQAARRAAADGVTLTIEPINARDMPGYFLSRHAQGLALLDDIGESNVKLQFDLYHAQVSEGDLATKIRRDLPTGRVAHFQVAGVPERHEPDRGELHAAYLFDVIDEVGAACGWQGWVGCEYRPARGAVPGATTAGLGWLQRRRGA